MFFLNSLVSFPLVKMEIRPLGMNSTISRPQHAVNEQVQAAQLIKQRTGILVDKGHDKGARIGPQMVPMPPMTTTRTISMELLRGSRETGSMYWIYCA